MEETKQIIGKIKKQVPLKKETTFKIGGLADYFVKAKNKKELKEAIFWAEENKLPFFILAGGSNVLISDKGVRGVVIKITGRNFSVLKNNESKSGKMEIAVWAGTNLSDLVNFSLENGLIGLEWAAGIPGSVGGAVRGNAGAFSQSIGKIVKEVGIIDTKSKKMAEKIIPAKDCRFSEKETIFKKNRNLIITSIIFQLKKGGQEKARNLAKEYLAYRERNHPLDFPSAGCVFKNNKITIGDKKIISQYPEIKLFNKNKLIPSSYLIDKSGLKGEVIGGAKVSEKHANFIINYNGKAKSADVVSLIKKVKEKVKNKFGVEIKEEIEILT